MNYEKEVRRIFELMKKHEESYEVSVNGILMRVDSNVFSPEYYVDTGWIGKATANYTRDKTFAEVGSGTGSISVIQHYNGADVKWATDINPHAVKNTIDNFNSHGIHAAVYEADIFSKEAEKVDVMLWNHPWHKGTKSEENLLKAGFDIGYQGLEKYIRDGHMFAEKHLLGTADHNFMDDIISIADKYNKSLTLLESEKVPLSKYSDSKCELRLYEIKHK